jgi:glycosyltransferase involved in cell wall biosynthesis
MRIGVYASLMASERGHEKNVSGHIQVPAHSVKLLHEAGHEVHLVTNRFGPEHALPFGIPAGVPLHLVDDGRRRPQVLRGGGSREGVVPSRLIRQLAQIRAVARDARLDVLHVFGLARSAMLAGALRATGIRAPVVVTLVGGNLWHPGIVARWLMRRVDGVLTATEHARRQCSAIGIDARIVRHGVIRDLVTESERDRAPGAPAARRHRVLFWRDPNEMNGADLCAAAFAALAPEFPGLSFDFAIRPTRVEVPGIDALADKHRNVHVHRFPYEGGVTLPGLIAESLLVILPFRKLTVDPQLAIAETLDAGVPVVTTDLRSSPELLEVGGAGAGAVVPVGEAAPLIAAMRDLLADRPRLDAMRDGLRERFRRVWSWDGYVAQLEDAYARVRAHARTAEPVA